jgi:hypothetical protein
MLAFAKKDPPGQPHMKRQDKAGTTGRRKPQGVRMAAGTTGRRRKVSKPGRNDPKSVKPPRQVDVLNTIVTHFEDVYQQLNQHMRLIATLQQQVKHVNMLIATGRLSKR